MKAISYVLLLLAPFCVSRPCTAGSVEPIGLEADLIAAMRRDPKPGERSISTGEAIRAYINAGLVSRKPDRRFDYTDYRALLKPVYFLGYTLVVLEEEYPSKYIGCCVSPGIGAVVRTSGDVQRLEIFAKANKCSVARGEEAEEALRTVGLRPEKGQYARISCRERDAEK